MRSFLPPNDSNVGKVSHVFEVHNPSRTQPLRLEIAQKPCSCTSCEVPQEPIPPGGVGNVAVTIATAHLEQMRTERVLLRPDLTDQPLVDCWTSFRSCPRVASSLGTPGQLLTLAVEPGIKTAKTIGLTALQPADEPAGNLQAIGTGQGVSTSALRDANAAVAAGVRRTTAEFDLVVDAAGTGQDDIGAIHEGELRVGYGEYWLQYRINWCVRAQIEVAPQAAFLQPAHEQGRRRTVVLKAREPFAIAGVESERCWLHAIVADGGHATVHRLTVAVDPDVAPNEQVS